jgi:CRP/FNR family transcriptional regulator, cyclic AMP receptor protein
VADQLPREPLPLARPVRAGAVLVRQGDPSPPARIVISGALLERAVTCDGRVLVPCVPGPGDLVGSVETDPSPVTVVALRRTVLRRAAADELAAGLARREARALALAANIAWVDTAARIEARLREIAATHGRPAAGGGLAIGLTLTQEDLAGLAGTTRESANRAVRSMIAAGLLDRTARGRYVLHSQLRLIDMR